MTITPFKAIWGLGHADDLRSSEDSQEQPFHILEHIQFKCRFFEQSDPGIEERIVSVI